MRMRAINRRSSKSRSTTTIREAEHARWLAENKEAIDHYNAFVEAHGLFGEEFRQF